MSDTLQVRRLSAPTGAAPGHPCTARRPRAALLLEASSDGPGPGRPTCSQRPLEAFPARCERRLQATGLYPDIVISPDAFNRDLGIVAHPSMSEMLKFALRPYSDGMMTDLVELGRVHADMWVRRSWQGAAWSYDDDDVEGDGGRGNPEEREQRRFLEKFSQLVYNVDSPGWRH